MTPDNQSSAAQPDLRVALVEAVSQSLGATYHCTRVWDAWNVGTMTQDDFEPIRESNTPEEIADSILAIVAPLLASRQQGEAVAWVDVPEGEQMAPEYPGYKFHGIKQLDAGKHSLYTAPPALPAPALSEGLPDGCPELVVWDAKAGKVIEVPRSWPPGPNDDWTLLQIGRRLSPAPTQPEAQA